MGTTDRSGASVPERRAGTRSRTLSALSSEQGATALIVLAVIAAVLLVGWGLFLLGSGEAGVVEYTADSSRAFFLAEAGIERARVWLSEFKQNDPSGNPVGTALENQALGMGQYSFEVAAEVDLGSSLEAYEIVSTGEVDGAIRQIRAVLLAESFAVYQWFIEDDGGGHSWFKTGERFEGPVHVNGDLKIDGDPWFGGRVTCVGHLIENPPSDPVFERGYEEGVAPVMLPTRDEIFAVVRTAALDAGTYAPSLGESPHFYYDVELGSPADGWFTYQGFTSAGVPVTAPEQVSIAMTNGVAWFDERIRIHGVLDGELTIGVDNDIEIIDDIVYEDSTPGSGPNPDCDDMLGLIAAGADWGDIIIAETTPNLNDCEVHAIMMALEKNIEAENLLGSGPLRGYFRIYGGLLADLSIRLAHFDQDIIDNGYIRDYHYDNRVLTMAPPVFPLTGAYIVFTWEEVIPPVVS